VQALVVVRPGRREITVDEIGVAHRRRVRCCGAPRLAAALRPLNGVAAHQPLDTTAPDPLTVPEERLPHPARSVGEVVRGVQLTNPAEQPLILDLAG
jgi:hypothetical protein